MAVLTVAAGLGPTVAVVSFVHALFLTPVPGVPDQQGLTVVQFARRTTRGGLAPVRLGASDRAALIARSESLAGLAGYQHAVFSVSAPHSSPARVNGAFVTPDYFDVLGVPFSQGRSFTVGDDLNGEAVAVITRRLADRLFNSSRLHSDGVLLVNSVPFAIVGVTAAPFGGAELSTALDVWLPAGVAPAVAHLPQAMRADARARNVFSEFIVRGKRPSTFAPVRDELHAFAALLSEHRPPTQRVEAVVHPGIGLPPAVRPQARRIVAILVVAALLLAVLTFANASNLLLCRLLDRADEIAMRAALGAAPRRLLTFCMLDGIILAVFSGILAAPLGALTLAMAGGIALPFVGQIEIQIDWLAYAGGLILALVLGTAFAISPALLAIGRARLQGPHDRTGGGRVSSPMRQALVVCQQALSVALVAAAISCVMAAWSVHSANRGFDASNTTSVGLNLADHGYDDERARRFFGDLIASSAAHPAVEGVALAASQPYSDSAFWTRLTSGHATDVRAAVNAVSPEYFRILRIPVLQGRTFDQRRVTAGAAPAPVVLSRSLADELFGDAQPLGRTLQAPDVDSGGVRRLVVVGVVGDVHWDQLDRTTPVLYEPLENSSYGLSGAVLLIRSLLPPPQVAEMVRRIAGRLDPAVPVVTNRSIAEERDQLAGTRFLLARFLPLVAVVAFIVATVGFHGVVAHAMAGRTREFAVRMAVGCGPGALLWMMIRQSLILSGVGALAGIAIAAALSAILREQLGQAAAPSSLTSTLAAACLLGTTLLTTARFSVRAVRTDIVSALRAE